MTASANQKNNMLRYGMVLFIVNLVAAGILTWVYTLTRPKIDEEKRLKQSHALREVMPEEFGDRIEPVTEDGKIKYWEVFKGSRKTPSGYIFIARRYGYSSVIESMVGIKKDGTITGVRILDQNETPGLGARVIEVVMHRTLASTVRDIFSKKRDMFKEGEETAPWFTEQFKGLNALSLGLSENGVHAITGATISSRAVVESIKEKAEEILEKNMGKER